MERKCDEKIADNIEEARQHLLHVQKEHETLVCLRSQITMDCAFSCVIIPKYCYTDSPFENLE